MTLLALIAGFTLGAFLTFGACWLWAMRAMHPHDELSELERYAMRANRAGGVE